MDFTVNTIIDADICTGCGLCVRVCKDNMEEPSLCFINRGFISIISEPLIAEFVDIPASVADKSIDICPTGALGYFENLEGK